MKTLIGLINVTTLEAIKMDCEGCEYLLDYHLFESTQFMGEVHLPNRFTDNRYICEGCNSSERLQLFKGVAPTSPEDVWKHLCEHGRFAIHGCETLRDWLVANSVRDLKSSKSTMR